MYVVKEIIDICMSIAARQKKPINGADVLNTFSSNDKKSNVIYIVMNLDGGRVEIVACQKERSMAIGFKKDYPTVESGLMKNRFARVMEKWEYVYGKKLPKVESREGYGYIWDRKGLFRRKGIGNLEIIEKLILITPKVDILKELFEANV